MVNVIHKSVTALVLLLLTIVSPCGILLASEGKAISNNALAGFIENKGQVRDQYNQPRNNIDYKLPAGALNIFIGAGELHYQWARPLTHDSEGNVLQHEGYRLDVILEGADTEVQPIAERPLGYSERYYTNGLNGVVANAYGKIVYRNIYPQIDWVLYLTGEGLKYDFLVHPGGDAGDIKITYKGATAMTHENGRITATTPMGSVTEDVPYSYYAHTDISIPTEYVLEGNTIGFRLGENNGNIVIDPSLEWSSYMGGSSSDRGMCTSSDTAGNVYMAGRTSSASSSNVYTSLAHQTVFAGNEDGVITRYTAGGVRIWSTYYGGAGVDAINAITVDKQNNIIFCGYTDTSYTGIASSNSVHQFTYGGGLSDCFLVKMNPGGQRIWGTYYGGPGIERIGTDYQTGVVCDTALNIYLVGGTQSDTMIASSGAYQATRGGGLDGFIAKFNTNGVRQWGTYYGGAVNDRFTIVGTDSAGVVYVAGNFQSTAKGTSGTHAPNKPAAATTADSTDVLIAKFNPATGNIIWATYYGGAGVDEARGLVVGDSSNVYICGSTESSTGIAITGAAQATFGGQRDMFLAKFDSSGDWTWGTYLGDISADNGGNVVLDHSGNLNTTGNTFGSSGLATPDGFSTSIGGGFDALIAIYSPGGDKIWATYFGGTGNDYGFGVARGKSSGHMYIVGSTESSTGISYNGAQNSYGGSFDAFIFKITPDTSVSIVKTSVQNTYCELDSFALSYVVTEPFRPGNVFTVQLSNSSGSFASPVIIGAKTSNVPGSINVGLPAGAVGTGYRIRILATLPLDTSYDNDFDINIKPLPLKPVATNNSPVCSNDTLKLFSTASTSGSAYSWVGPGTYAATTQNAIRTNMTAATHSGDYIVTANLNGCTRKDTTTATIIQAAAKPDLVSNSPLCTGDNLVLTATNLTQNMGMKWAGPNGFSDTGTISTTAVSRGTTNVTTADAGNYVFTVWMNNCPSRDTAVVTVAQRPNPVTASSNSPVCSHESLQLTANTTTPGVVYNWTGPGGFIANNKKDTTRTNLQTSYSGNYVVEADMLGCKVRDTITVTINQSPAKPVATANKTAICSDEDLVLTGTNVTGPTRLWTHAGSAWNGGTNNNTATRYNIQLPDAGDYIFTVSNGNGCQQRDTVTITVTQSFPIPITAVASPGTVVCPTTAMAFIPLGKPTGAQVKWTDPNLVVHQLDTFKIPSVAYADSGWYVVEVVTGACSLAVDSVHLSVVDTISPPILTLPSYGCEGDTLQLNAFHPHLDSFYLTYPGGINFGPFKSITFNGLTIPDNHGTYILKVQSGGCTAYDTGYLEVRTLPAQPVASNNGPLCEGETLNLFTNSSTGGVTYAWNGPSGYSSTTQNPSIPNVDSPTHAGYYLSRAYANGCFSTADTTQVEIIRNPKPEIISNSPVCEGDNIVMGVQPAGDETYSWSSVSNPGFSGTGSGATVNNSMLNDGGLYIVTATSGATGCVGRDTADVQVIPLPGIPEAYYNGPLCEGDTLVLNVNDTSTNVTYTWAGPGNFAFPEKQATRIPAELSSAGVYVVTVNRDKCSIRDSIDVVVKPRPEQPDIKSNSPLATGEKLYLEMLNPTAGASFQWRGPNNYGSLVQNPVIENVTVAASGPYTLVTTLNGCSSSAITIVVVNKGEAEVEELILFPNPNDGNFTIKAKVSRDQIMPYEVVNVLGMVVYADVVQTENRQMERKIELDGGMASGVYIFRTMMSGKSREILFTVVR